MLVEQRGERRVARRLEHLQQPAHLAAHRQLLAGDQMMPVPPGARNEPGPGGLQVGRRHLGQPRRGDPVEPDADRREVAVGQRQGVELARRLLHPLVLQQPADQLGARIVGLGSGGGGGFGSSRRDLDLDQHRGHQQVLGGELELRATHHLDVVEVLPRQLRHRDVEHVDVLPADQVQQQVERTLEGLEEDFERLGRDVQVPRHLQHRLAVDPGHRRPACAARSGARPARSANSGVALMNIPAPSPRARRASSRPRAREPSRSRPR